MLTIQDLIYYEVGAYHDSPQAWERVRASVRQAVRDVDGVVVDRPRRRGADPPTSGCRSRPTALFVVENGTDHLSGDESASVPPGAVPGGRLAEPFLLVLGTNYGHKNRAPRHRRPSDLLREQDVSAPGHGRRRRSPAGSTRVAESRVALRSDTPAHVLPDVTSQERNWLLRHASLVLYPTSAEGFGLVPYEAARFGTPTVHVSFGPLAEVLTGSARRRRRLGPRTSWPTPAGALLDDPDLLATAASPPS